MFDYCATCHTTTADEDMLTCADCNLRVCGECWERKECCAVACGACWSPTSVCGHPERTRE